MAGFNPNLIKKIFDTILLHKQAPFVSGPVSCKQALIKIPGGRWRLNNWVPHLTGHLLGIFQHGSLLSQMLPILSILKIASKIHFWPKTANFGPKQIFLCWLAKFAIHLAFPNTKIDLGPKWADLGQTVASCRYAAKMMSDAKKMC